MNENFSFKLWEIEGRKRIFSSNSRKSRVKREMKIYIFLNREREISLSTFNWRSVFSLWKTLLFWFYRTTLIVPHMWQLWDAFVKVTGGKSLKLNLHAVFFLYFQNTEKHFFPKLKMFVQHFLIRKCLHTSSVPFVQDKTLHPPSNDLYEIVKL